MKLDVMKLELSDILDCKSSQNVMTEVNAHSSQPNDEFSVHLVFEVDMMFFKMCQRFRLPQRQIWRPFDLGTQLFVSLVIGLVARTIAATAHGLTHKTLHLKHRTMNLRYLLINDERVGSEVLRARV